MNKYYIKSIEELKLEYIYTTLYNINNLLLIQSNKWFVFYVFRYYI